MEKLLVLSGITVAAMASPGPDMFLLIRNSLRFGKRDGFATVLGICAGLGVHLSLSLFGLTWLITQNVYVYECVKYAGAFYLFYLGIQALKSSGNSSIPTNDSSPGSEKANGFQNGLLTNLLNPKVTIFIFAIFTQFIEPGDALLTRITYGLVLLLTVFVGWTSFVLFLQSEKVRNGLQKFGKTLDRIFGIAMILLALRVAFTRG